MALSLKRWQAARRPLFLLCFVPALLWAQDYYEASGQSAVFTLKAVTTATYTPIKASPVVRHIRIIYDGTKLRVFPAARGTLRIYQPNGRTLNVCPVDGAGMAAIKWPLGNGVYLLRFEADGLSAESFKLAVTSARGQR
jgi:hypothetical protein